MLMRSLPAAARVTTLVTILAIAPVDLAHADDDRTPPAPRSIPANLLEPLPRTGAVPPIVRDPTVPSFDELRIRARTRDYHGQIGQIVRRLERERRDDRRTEIFAELEQFTDPAALPTLVDALIAGDQPTQAWLLDHLSSLGHHGQAGLAYAAIVTEDRLLRDSAAARLDRPASPSVLMTIDAGLRDRRHAVVNAAGWLAGQLQALEAIPPMIFAQAIGTPVRATGDLAWIAIGTTTTYVANVVPVVGGGSGAFQPVLGSVTEGTLLRVMDAVVVEGGRRDETGRRQSTMGTRQQAVVYRIDLHNALVAMTSAEWGRSTAHLAYDMPAWNRWFNEEFVPNMRERDAIDRLLRDEG